MGDQSHCGTLESPRVHTGRSRRLLEGKDSLGQARFKRGTPLTKSRESVLGLMWLPEGP